MATPLPIDERLDTAGHLVIRARIFYDVWWLYEGADTRPKIIHTMNHYPEYFRFDSHAHFLALVIHLAALFERRDDTINLPSLLAELATSNLAPTATVTEVQEILEEAAPLAQKTIILRSNLFAHRSASLSYAKAFEKADVTANQLGYLCELALQIVNQLLLARGLDERLVHTVPRSHAESMLRALAKE
ncbi:MAG: hypothetical protein KF771_02140 [Burkholderiales bacterium]|nr:hypothetical protein [Burkholderiales bacterium]